MLLVKALGEVLTVCRVQAVFIVLARWVVELLGEGY